MMILVHTLLFLSLGIAKSSASASAFGLGKSSAGVGRANSSAGAGLGKAIGASFVTLGDWGGSALLGDAAWSSSSVAAVAKQLATTAAAADAQFVLNVGDNFYWCGIQNTSDPQIKADYIDPYMGYESLRVPWISALGNHAYGYNATAQTLLATEGGLEHWVMDARYYSRRVELGSEGSGEFATIIVLDTNPCVSEYRSEKSSGWDPCGSEYPTCSLTSDPKDDFEGPCKFHENILTQDCDAQLEWFKSELDAVPASDWLFINAHHPAGEVDVSDFSTPLQKHGFDLYLNGHAHTLTHYSIGGNGAYVTSGSASQVKLPSANGTAAAPSDCHDEAHVRGLPPSKRRQCDRELGKSEVSAPGLAGFQKETKIWGLSTPGFTLHTFSSDFSTLTTEFLDYTGQMLHTFTVDKASSRVAGGGGQRM